MQYFPTDCSTGVSSHRYTWFNGDRKTRRPGHERYVRPVQKADTGYTMWKNYSANCCDGFPEQLNRYLPNREKSTDG